jgi:hypothetical protein
MKHIYLTFGHIVLVLALAACNTATPAPAATAADQPAQATEAHIHTAEPLTAPETAAQPLAWQEIPLADARTGDSFKLSDYAGQVVFLEIIARGCPPCVTQIKEVGAALEQIGDKAKAVSVDYSAFSPPDTLATYADSLEAGWIFAVTTKEFRAALVSEFGPEVIAVSATPIIVIEPSGATHFTEPGIKQSSTLVELANQYNP